MKQFGYWKEHNKDYIDNPSIHDFVNSEISKTYQKEKLVQYLKSGGMVCVTSGLAFLNPFTKEPFSGSFAVLTDGVWEWLEDLALYVEKYDVIIPDEWYRYIESVSFKIPEAVKKESPDVDWGKQSVNW